MKKRPEKPEGWVDKEWSREEQWGAERAQQAHRQLEYSNAVGDFLQEVALDVLVVLRGADLTTRECELVLNGLRNSIVWAAKELGVIDIMVKPPSSF